MVASLVKEDSNSGTSCLEQLAELVHCMVFRFPGFPDLYEPVMEAIRVSGQSLWHRCQFEPSLRYHGLVAASTICSWAVSRLLSGAVVCINYWRSP